MATNTARDHELEPALVQSGVQNICDAQSLPQATEQERPADPAARDPTGRHVRQQNGLLAVARERGRQPVQLTRGEKGLFATQCADDALPHAPALDQVPIGGALGDLLAQDHAPVFS